jgi:AcrR family transcriptional regulator
MPKVTEAHLEARRRQILEAACSCLSRKGFHQTTIRDICRESGLSAGAIYGYFKSKDEILEALADMGRENTSALLDSMMIEGPASDVLAHLLSEMISVMDSEDSQMGVRVDVRLWGEALSTPRIQELFLEALPNTAAPFVDLVRQGQEAGELAAGLDPEKVARVFIALCLGIQVQKALDPETSLAGCSEVISALVTGAFRSEGSTE